MSRGNFFSLSPFLRGEGWGEGHLSTGAKLKSPSPGLLRNPTSPRKNGERQRKKTYAAFASDDFISANAQSIHCVSSATSFASTVAPHQMRRPAGASR